MPASAGAAGVARAQRASASAPRRASGRTSSPPHRSTPACSKPSARCTPIEPALAESPITASIWRAPRASQRASSSASSRRPTPWPVRVGREVDRVLQAEAVGAARPEVVGVGIAEHPAVALGHQPGQALGEHVVAPARHLGLVGRIELEGAGAVQHVPAVDGGDGGQVGGRAGADQQRGGGHRAGRSSRAEFIMRGFR